MDRAWIEQVTLLPRRDELLEQLLIERGRTTWLRFRAVLNIHVRRCETEQQARREGGRRLGPPADQFDTAIADICQQSLETGQVEMIVEALAEGLGDDRKVRVLAGDLEQVPATQP